MKFLCGVSYQGGECIFLPQCYAGDQLRLRRISTVALLSIRQYMYNTHTQRVLPGLWCTESKRVQVLWRYFVVSVVQIMKVSAKLRESQKESFYSVIINWLKNDVLPPLSTGGSPLSTNASGSAVLKRRQGGKKKSERRLRRRGDKEIPVTSQLQLCCSWAGRLQVPVQPAGFWRNQGLFGGERSNDATAVVPHQQVCVFFCLPANSVIVKSCTRDVLSSRRTNGTEVLLVLTSRSDGSARFHSAKIFR